MLDLKPLILAACLLTTSALTCAHDRNAAPTIDDRVVSKKMVAEARRMLAGFKESRYSHKTMVDPTRGIYNVDCSGFIVVILKTISGNHLEQIETSHKRPLAEDFYNAFMARGRSAPEDWRRIERLSDAQPGDVIAWIKLDREPGDNTGHVVMVAEKPIAETTRRWRVRILDSTLRGHAEDTRPEGKSGIGQGTIWLSTDADGRPIGFRWKSQTGILHHVPIAIGRAIPSQKNRVGRAVTR